MKSFTNLSRTGNFLIIAGILSLLPFSYVFGQNIDGKFVRSTTISLIPHCTSKTTFNSLTEITELEGDPINREFIPIKRVRSGIVESINYEDNSFVIKIKNINLSVETNSTTTVFFGEGETASLNDISVGDKIYAFGFLRGDKSTILTSKIVISDKSIFEH